MTATPGKPRRNVSGKCRKPDPNLQHRTARAKRASTAHLSRRLGRLRVKPGARYEFEVIARDSLPGNASKPQRVAFQVDGEPSDSGF